VAASPVNLNPFPARSIRHETWLGICVVMLLVFALGFLVYQKVERHERQLTQAAIASPNAEPPEVADTQPIAAAATDAELVDATAADPASAATDPLNAATISDVSPFLEPPAAHSATWKQRYRLQTLVGPQSLWNCSRLWNPALNHRAERLWNRRQLK